MRCLPRAFSCCWPYSVHDAKCSEPIPSFFNRRPCARTGVFHRANTARNTCAMLRLGVIQPMLFPLLQGEGQGENGQRPCPHCRLAYRWTISMLRFCLALLVALCVCAPIDGDLDAA